jgi:hypothetical protein
MIKFDPLSNGAKNVVERFYSAIHASSAKILNRSDFGFDSIVLYCIPTMSDLVFDVFLRIVGMKSALSVRSTSQLMDASTANSGTVLPEIVEIRKSSTIVPILTARAK